MLKAWGIAILIACTPATALAANGRDDGCATVRHADPASAACPVGHGESGTAELAIAIALLCCAAVTGSQAARRRAARVVTW